MSSRASFFSSRWAPALLCAAFGAAVFEFFGNATRGYVDSGSLFRWWGSQWINAQSETEHGLIVAAIAGWLIWRNLHASRAAEIGDRRSEFDQAPTLASGVWGWEFGIALAAMIFGLLLNVAGFAGQQTRVSAVGLLFFLWGVLRMGGGKRWGDAAIFPLAFMVFAIPFNALDSIGFWLRLWVIKASTGLAHLAGISVVQNGTQLVSADGRYQYDVAPACSGIRSLVALLALAVLMGYLNFRLWWRRVLLVALCFPLIYLGNVARISSIIFFAQWGGQKWGERAHDVMGFGVFAIVLGGLLAVARVGTEGADGSKEQDAGSGGDRQPAPGKNPFASHPSPFSARQTWSAAGVVCAACLGALLFLWQVAHSPLRGEVGVRLAADGRNPIELPAFLGTEWIGRRAEVTPIEREILPADTGYSRRDYILVADASKHVFVSIVLSGRDRTSIHRPELCLEGQGWTIDYTREGHFSFPAAPRREFPVTELLVRHQIQTPRGIVDLPQVVAYWFVSGDRVTASNARRQLIDAWQRLAEGRVDRWAYVLVQADARDGVEAAHARIQTVLDQTLPSFLKPEVFVGRKP